MERPLLLPPCQLLASEPRERKRKPQCSPRDTALAEPANLSRSSGAGIMRYRPFGKGWQRHWGALGAAGRGVHLPEQGAQGSWWWQQRGQLDGAGSWEATLPALGSPLTLLPRTRQLPQQRSPTPTRPRTTHRRLRSQMMSLRWALGLRRIPGKSWHRPAGTAVLGTVAGTALHPHRTRKYG